MSIKLLIAIILVIIAFGSGLYQWILSGMTSGFPILSFVLLAVSGFFIIAWFKDRKKPRHKAKLPLISSLNEEKVVIGGLVGAAIAGTLLASYLEGKKRKYTRSELERIEQELDELLHQGKISYEKYYELKQKIIELKNSQ